MNINKRGLTGKVKENNITSVGEERAKLSAAVYL